MHKVHTLTTSSQTVAIERMYNIKEIRKVSVVCRPTVTTPLMGVHDVVHYESYMPSIA
jgi:hypothetical protein